MKKRELYAIIADFQRPWYKKINYKKWIAIFLMVYLYLLITTPPAEEEIYVNPPHTYSY